ncbi:LRR-GTPase of the ROCO family, putative pseudogene [Ectocarpus siliculosus]|nr:LRR-GTPase of the ROCO family, putative pseudogene [Ectocarpus siliculosus]|eukprot:CBJ29670.1 LRR-GTPase of the ROCO family, putative pseudogene [Ectocarpus siliculosus]
MFSQFTAGSIPKELGALTDLERRDLAYNRLTAFWRDEGWARCVWRVSPAFGKWLQCTWYAFTRKTSNSLPKQLEALLATLSQLGLYVHKNPWQEPPEAVVSIAPVGRKMMKIVLVGQEGAGKTSLRQILRTGRPTPTRGPEESTVHMDAEQIDVNGATFRVYDCAGQVAYTGLLQMFLSPRAASLLVCDTGAFGQRDSSLTDGDRLKKDLSKLQALRVCDWLRSLSLRIPDSDVVMVTTKCDLAAGMAADTAGRIEGAIGKWLESWSGAGMTAVRVENWVSLTSCLAPTPNEDGGATLGKRKSPGEQSTWACDWREGTCVESHPSLLHRVMYNSQSDLRGASLVLPRSWNIALEVLDALGSGRDPVDPAHQTVLASALQGDGGSIVNPDHAVEGALLIREHEGSLVRHETYVFLDVTWLTQSLKPLLNHRDDEDPFCGDVSLGDTGITLKEDKHIASWNRLKGNGVLEPSLARVLWPDGLSNYVLPALDSLGLTYPLDDDPAEGLVVLLRLHEKRPEDVGALRTFWCFGVLVQGSLGGVAAKTFALLIEYSHETCEVDMKVYGSISTAAPWAALSFGTSVFQAMCSEFPGLRWRASLKCPQHEQEMQISKAATRPGDNILLDKLFQEMAGRLVQAQDRYPVLRPEAARGLHPEQSQRRFDAWWDGVKEEMGDMLRGARGPIGGEAVGSTASVASAEVARLERLVNDLQQQVGQQHQDVRERIGAVDTRLVDMIDADDGVMGRLDFLVVMMMAMRREGFDTPRRACVLPPWDLAQGRGLSDEEQAPECWVKRLDQWREDDFKQGKGIFKKKLRLFLVCAATHRLVPCGPDGQGYDIQHPRTWFRMSVSVATFVLQVVCATLAAIAAAPLSGAGALAEETFSAALGSMESMLEAQLAGQTLDDGGVDVAAGPQTAQLEGGVYSSLREFIHGVEDTARLEIAKATKKAHRERRAPPSSSEFVFFEQKMVQVQRRDGDAAVQWVLKGHESSWFDQTRSAPVL